MSSSASTSKGFFGKILSWIPGWLGFLLLILVGIAAILLEAFAGWPGSRWSYVGGVWAVVVASIFWIGGATSEIKGRVGTVGVKVSVSDVPPWAWIVNGVVTAVVFVTGWVMLG